MGVLIASYLSPGDLPLLDRIVTRIGAVLGIRTTLSEGTSYDDVAAGQYDLALLCGLAYVVLVDDEAVPLRPLCAPVYAGGRYRGLAQYASDVVVRHDHPAQSLNDLAGATVGLNDPLSQSGVGVLGHALVSRGLDWTHFGRLLWTGSHAASAAAVSDGSADVAVIDAHVLDRLPAALVRPLRAVETLGPSPTQPVVAHARCRPQVAKAIATGLCSIRDDTGLAGPLQAHGYSGFVSVSDATYDAIRAMRHPEHDPRPSVTA
jgi:phosphonate transport system substrate-binding protein